MKNNKVLQNCNGMSVLELIIGLLISAIVIIGIYRVANSVTIATTRENQKAEMIRSLTSVSNVIERDIRMAGIGLPGNGIRKPSPGLALYSNENGVSTLTKSEIVVGTINIKVEDVTGFDKNKSVCIMEHDTIYRDIASVTDNPTGVDDVITLASRADTAFPIGSRIFSARKILYFTRTVNGKTELRRTCNNNTSDVGRNLGHLAVIPKDSVGVTVALDREAAVLEVVLGGSIGTNANQYLMKDTTEVNIRNN